MGTLRMTQDITITTGRGVVVYPVSRPDGLPRAGAVTRPTPGIILDAYLGSSWLEGDERVRVRVRLHCPGEANHLRVVNLPATGLKEEV